MSPELAELLVERRRQIRLLKPDVTDSSGLQHCFVSCVPPLSCHGQCCDGGAGLLEVEGRLLAAFAAHEKPRLDALGVTPGIQFDERGWRTSVHKAPASPSCSWRCADGRCSLHLMALEDGRNWWAYKPLACSLYPFRARTRNKLRTLTIDGLCKAENGPPCTRSQPQNAAERTSEPGEFAIMADVWDMDMPLMRAACESPERNLNAATRYCVAVTAKHALFGVGENEEGNILEKKSLRPDGAADLLQAECYFLERLQGPWFPRWPEFITAEHGGPVLRMEHFKGRLPLNLWLRTQPKLSHVVEAVMDLLRACDAMQRAGVFHLDLAMRNVLIAPASRQVAVVDFENAALDNEPHLCKGGQWGLAAPEQYLNRLGQHTHRTETFFCGAVLWTAIADCFGITRQATLPVAAWRSVIPGALWPALTGLLGDPQVGFSPSGRLDATAAIVALENVDMTALDEEIARLQAQGPSLHDHDSTRIDSIELQGPQGLLMQAGQKAIHLFHEGELVDSLLGLVDLNDLPHEWMGLEYRFGPWVCDKNGFRRLMPVPEPDAAQSSCPSSG